MINSGLPNDGKDVLRHQNREQGRICDFPMKSRNLETVSGVLRRVESAVAVEAGNAFDLEVFVDFLDLGIGDTFHFLQFFVAGEVAHVFTVFHDLSGEIGTDVGIGGEFVFRGAVQIGLFSGNGGAGKAEGGDSEAGKNTLDIHDTFS